MKEKFNLIQAMTYLKEGKKVRKETWFSDAYIYEGDNGVVYLNHNVRGNGNSIFGLNGFSLTSNIWEVYEEKPILDTEEKAYLEAVLRPFKDKAVSICKSSTGDYEYLWIHIKNAVRNNLTEHFYLPNFKPNTMYKGMEVNKEYTLKELGLFDRKIY